MKSNRDQLGLTLSDYPALRLSLPVLDARLRGTKFVAVNRKSILNSPKQTGVDFWSLNPYVGCEFGCSYCYARYAHRYVVERAHDTGNLSDGEFQEFRGPHGWEAFERRIFVKDQLLGALEADLRRYYRSLSPSARPPGPPGGPVTPGGVVRGGPGGGPRCRPRGSAAALARGTGPFPTSARPTFSGVGGPLCARLSTPQQRAPRLRRRAHPAHQ